LSTEAAEPGEAIEAPGEAIEAAKVEEQES
jgi:hypothetical protein